MPPMLISPLIKWTLVAVGGAAMVQWVVKEVRRANDELERAKVRIRISEKPPLRTLRRDPATGEYRAHQH